MSKKILLADKSDAIRNIAESLLLQNGYDVISAASVEKAKELVITSQPNMVVVGADLKDPDGKFLYDALEDNPMTAAIPILIIADPEGHAVPFPEEVILPRPFDPKEFLEKIRLFVGGGIEKKTEEKITSTDPFAAGTIDDEFLDAALGIDNIDVESSTVMDKSYMTGKIKIPPELQDKTGGFGILQHGNEDSKKNESQRVESLMIRDEASSATPPKSPATPSGTSKIEIASDQYGLISADKPHEVEVKSGTHDYNWFIKEMQKDAAGFEPKAVPNVDADDIKFSSSTDSVEPILSPSGKNASKREKSGLETPAIKPGGVDKFVADFKEEMSAMNEAPEAPSEAPAAVSEAVPEAGGINEAEIRHFANYIAELLAERIAKAIVDKIDSEEIYRLVRDDFINIIAAKK
ncbi:hypothetical protein TRIP_C21469 [Candidatus Zixiibacteriota bacterium]|nr:hypothetical protein TRIP_C21469 [candidate division Zixibacteria bacterium]